MKTKIEEIAFLAKEKGFEAKTLSTKFTMNTYLGINKSKTFLINETCDYLLLTEMQKWLREKHDKYISIIFGRVGEADCTFFVELYCWVEWKSYKVEVEDFNTYEEALSKGLLEAFKLIKNK